MLGIRRLYRMHGEYKVPGGKLVVVDFEVRDREFFGIIGPTGCGKTTLLHIIAGLEQPTTGSVEFVGEKRTKSMVSMVFQDSALMPWRSVEENVPLGAEFRNEHPSMLKRVSQFFLEVVRLLDFGKAYLNTPPDYSPEVLADADEMGRELFDDRWPEVQKVVAELADLGIYYYDTRPSNIDFGDDL